MRPLVATLFLVTGGCHLVFGLERPPPDAVQAIDAVDAVPVVCDPHSSAGAAGSRRLGFVGATLSIDSARMLGGNRYFVGVLAGTAASDSNDGLIVRSGNTVASWTIGGAQNDQLWGAADDGTTVLAVGMTRSFLSGTTSDQGLAVKSGASGVPIASRYQSTAGDHGVVLSAAAPLPAGWLVAGRYQDSQQLLVTRLGVDLSVEVARSMTLNVSGLYRARKVIVGGEGAFLLGTVGAVGFVMAVDPTAQLPVKWVVSLPFEPVDGELSGGSLDVAGFDSAEPDAGLSASLATDTGAITSAIRIPGLALHRIVSTPAGRWIAGPAASGVLVGRIADRCVHTVLHPDIGTALPLLLPLPLSVDPATEAATLVGTAGLSIVERPLDGDGASVCASSGGAVVTDPIELTSTRITATTQAIGLTRTLLPTSNVAAKTPTVTQGCP